jgi:hypothetical protein
LFNFYTKSASFGVSNKQKTNQNSLLESIFNGVKKNLKIQKFAELFGSQRAPPVSMTLVAIRHRYQTPAAKLPLVSRTLVANNGNTIRLLSP